MSMIWISLNRWLFAAEMFDFLPHLSTSFYLVCFGTLFPFFLTPSGDVCFCVSSQRLGKEEICITLAFQEEHVRVPILAAF
jgi:hypothetical protein